VYDAMPARYARGMIAVCCHSADGFKTAAHRACDRLRARYSNRERAYIMPPSKFRRLPEMIASDATR